MQALPDDIAMNDMQTFPRFDPVQQAAIDKENAKEQKQREAIQREAEKEAKRNAAKAQEIAKMPTQRAKQAVAVEEVNTLRSREIKSHKIRLYFKKLGHKLSMKEPAKLPKDDAGINELLATIETELQSAGGIENAGNLFVAGCAGFEHLTLQFNPLGLMLSGPAVSLSQVVMANKEKWDELITELAIANAEWFMMGPAKRALLFAAQMVQTVDQANKIAIIKMHSAPVAKEKEEEAKDL